MKNPNTFNSMPTYGELEKLKELTPPNQMSEEKEKVVKKYFDIDYPINLTDNDSEFVGSIGDIYEKAFIRGKSIGFNQGYICATANIIKTHGEDTIAKDVLNANFSLEDADEHDLEILKPIIDSIKSV